MVPRSTPPVTSEGSTWSRVILPAVVPNAYTNTGLLTGGISSMRTPLYDVNARRKTVSVTLNADLVSKASALGINISRTAEAALIKAFEAAEVAKIREEIREAVRITDDLVARHGLPFPEFGLFDPDSASDDAA
jgi:antitoxin CcdA